ncbi:tigger transposable element-derived protein 1-like [Cherax quadricarinatus]|uniref:tigger transposable element-derived protein 1-like n=1 Tax=Cherax quadricarinatus TaxID=27406 RepID=UPI00387E567E
MARQPVQTKKAAEKYVKDFKEYIETENLKPEQVFNCDETGLFWKKMPNRTYITQEENALPGHKPMKDRLTLMLCNNASGDCKVKPLLMYHSDTPRVFRKNNIIKGNLCVLWRSNSKAWVTRVFFLDWFYGVFGPTVTKYLQEKKLPLKCLLVMDNAPVYPYDLQEDIAVEFGFVKVKFLPPNTTALLQPTDQQVISNFKKLYTKTVFQKCIEVTSDTQSTLREFWKDHFNNLSCINLIGKAWEEVTKRTLNSAWWKLCPQCVQERNFDGFGANLLELMPVVEAIVSLGKSLGLEVCDEDVEELMQNNEEELTTADLQELQVQQQWITSQECSSEEEEERWRKMTSSRIKEMCSMFTRAQAFLDDFYLVTEVANRIGSMYNDTLVSHFREILRAREKQSSLERYFVQQGSSDSQAGPSGIKKPRREVTPPKDLVPQVFMEGDSPSKQ